MEKIVLKDGTELAIDGISRTGNSLQVTVNNGNMEELEGIFSKPENLEKIILESSDGAALNAYKNYTQFSEISKKKDVIVDQITEETADIVTVTLEQEPEWKVEQRKLRQGYDSAIGDLGEAVSELAEGSVQ